MLIVEGHQIINYSEQMTDEELFAFCQDNKALRIERDADNNIIIMAPVSGESGFYEGEFIIDVGIWVRQTGKGVSFSSSTGFVLPNGAMRSPDAAWMSKERWDSIPAGKTKKFLTIIPDFIVEVLSVTDSLKKTQTKMTEWIDNGVRLAWLVDVYGKQVFVYRADGTIDTISGLDQTLIGEDVMEGFSFDLAQLRLP